MSKPHRMTVYISGPITGSGDLYTNLHNGIKVWRELVKKGYAPYCPHMNDLGYIVTGEPLSWEEALEVDREFVIVSDALLRLPGPSKGADREEMWARHSGVPVFESVAELELYHQQWLQAQHLGGGL